VERILPSGTVESSFPWQGYLSSAAGGVLASDLQGPSPDGGWNIEQTVFLRPDGTPLASTVSWTWFAGNIPEPLLLDGHALAVEGRESLVDFDPSSGSARWRRRLAEDAGPGELNDWLLTARPGVLFAQHRWGPGLNFGEIATFSPELVELALDGVEALRCPLPEAEYHQSLLLPGRWVAYSYDPQVGVAIQAFAVPGASPGAAGWTGQGGGPSRQSRPLP